MAIVPSFRCSNMARSLAFYTEVLDFVLVDGFDAVTDPAFNVVSREGNYLILSSNGGDGAYGAVAMVSTNDVDAVFRRFLQRGLRTPGNSEAPVAVHEGPIDQTWGTREFYVEDPDGNTLRFTQGWD